VQLPLFSGYCFVRFRRPDRLRVLKAVGVVGLVGPSGEPEPIPDCEIEAIRALTGSRLAYEPFPFLAEGMAVEVVRGPLMESEGSCSGKIVNSGTWHRSEGEGLTSRLRDRELVPIEHLRVDLAS
jgi:transcription antitermination factor NusG